MHVPIFLLSFSAASASKARGTHCANWTRPWLVLSPKHSPSDALLFFPLLTTGLLGRGEHWLNFCFLAPRLSQTNANKQPRVWGRDSKSRHRADWQRIVSTEWLLCSPDSDGLKVKLESQLHEKGFSFQSEHASSGSIIGIIYMSLTTFKCYQTQRENQNVSTKNVLIVRFSVFSFIRTESLSVHKLCWESWKHQYLFKGLSLSINLRFIYFLSFI